VDEFTSSDFCVGKRISNKTEHHLRLDNDGIAVAIIGNSFVSGAVLGGSMNDIFISYAREDLVFIRRLSEAFKERSHTVWVDLDGLYVGEEYWPRIRDAIAESDTFLFVISPDSARSTFCRREINRAVQLQKRIVPILYRDISTDDLSPAIAERQWQILRETDDFTRHIEALITAIAIDPTWIRAHTYWLNKASQWDDKGRDYDFLLRGKELNEAQDWLGQASQHPDPQPTQLQIDYITVSRNAVVERIRQKRRLAQAVCSLFALLMLFAVWQWRTAEHQRKEAEQSAAQEQKAKEEATTQRKRALARQLTIQAEAFYNQRPEWHFLSTRLAIEAAKLFPSPEIDQALHRGSPLIPCAAYSTSVPVIALSPSGKTLVSTGYDCTALLTDLDDSQFASRLQHQASVALVTFSRDGQYLATVTLDGGACLWNGNTGKQLFCLPAERKVSAVAFSADSKYIAVASYLNRAWLWEFTRCHSIDCPPSAQLAHEDGVNAIAFSPDDTRLVTASWDNKARLWNVAHCLKTECQPSTVLQHENGVHLVAFSPDSHYLATVGYDPLIRMWDVTSCTRTDCQPVAPFLRHDSTVTALAFSRDGRLLASGGWDRKARLWSMPHGKPLAQFSHDLGVSTVAFSQDGQSLATGSYDRRACVWTIATGKRGACLGHDTAVTGVVFHPNGQQLITSSYDSAVHLWSPFQGHIVEDRAHVDPITTIATSADGEYVATVSQIEVGSQPTDVALWRRSTQQLVARLPHHTDIAKLMLSRDGQYLALAGWDNTVELWKLAGAQKEMVAHVSHDSDITALAVSPNGKRLATGGWAGTVLLWDVTRCHNGLCRPFSLPSGPNSGITALAFSPDNNVLVTAGWDNTAQVWDLTTQPPQLRSVARQATTLCPETAMSGQTSGITAVAFNSTGTLFATASYDHSARVWNLHGQQQACVSDINGFTAVAFDATDTYLAAATWEKTVRVWEIIGAKETTRLRTEAGITKLTFDTRNKLLTTGWDHVVRQWTWERNARLAEACESLQERTLSKAEWEQYLGTEEPYRASCTPDGRQLAQHHDKR
jgi:WD40 repeat protein